MVGELLACVSDAACDLCGRCRGQGGPNARHGTLATLLLLQPVALQTGDSWAVPVPCRRPIILAPVLHCCMAPTPHSCCLVLQGTFTEQQRSGSCPPSQHSALGGLHTGLALML